MATYDLTGRRHKFVAPAREVELLPYPPCSAVIVSRHKAAVDFIRAEVRGAEDMPVLDSASEADIKDKIVFGNLPLHLAAAAKAVVAVEFDGDPPRGREYTAEDMRRAGAKLRLYTVSAVDRGAGVPIDLGEDQWGNPIRGSAGVKGVTPLDPD